MLRIALVLVLVACGGEPSPPEAPPPPRVEPADVEPNEAAPSPWPLETASLDESLQRFEDVPSCVAGLRARVPVELAESLADLGYDAVLDDVCRALEAAKTRDPSACDALGATALRDGCRRRVALASSDPEHCPPARGLEGRDPSCLAWTSGVTRLCDATVGDVRRTCVAVATNDERACRRDATCEAAVRRYGDAVVSREEREDVEVALTIVRSSTTEASPSPTRATGALGGASAGTSALGGASAGTGAPDDPSAASGGGASRAGVDEPEAASRTEHAAAVARGVVLTSEGCASRLRIEVGGPLSEGPQLTLEVVARRDEDGAWRGEVRDLRWAPRRLAVPTVLMEPAVDELSLDRRRGGALAMRVRGRLGTDVTIGLTLRTFVRDLDALPAACATR